MEEDPLRPLIRRLLLYWLLSSPLDVSNGLVPCDGAKCVRPSWIV